MKVAKELLANTDRNINEIAAEVGFGSNRTFYKKFKKYMGMAPKEYRRAIVEQRKNGTEKKEDSSLEKAQRLKVYK